MTSHLTFADKIGILDPNGESINPLTGEEYHEIYTRLSKKWVKYPAYSKSREILESISSYPLTFIISGTGSGKTVFVPKLALHYLAYKGRVAITLPKRETVLEAAIFSAQTLDVTLGDQIGYRYKGSPEKLSNESNKIVYLTDGMLYVQYLQDPLLSQYDVIIIDEAHERKLQIDILLLILRNLLLSKKRPDLRVIIMSATIDTKKYLNFFSPIVAGVLHIEGLKKHDITVHYLEKEEPNYLRSGLDIIQKINKESGDIIFFITSGPEAKKFCEQLHPIIPDIFCIEFYAELDETSKMYAKSPDKFLELGDYRKKIILATNIAESSITIDGLVYVLDSGFELYTYFNPEIGGTVYEKRMISQSQALQRRGRVGRNRPGVCFHLMTERQFANLDKFPTPEILKQDLTSELLKLFDITPNGTFPELMKVVSMMMDRPAQPYLDYSLKLYRHYHIIDAEDRITSLGIKLVNFSMIPLHRALFLVYSYQNYCAKEACVIVAMLELSKGQISHFFIKDLKSEKQNIRQISSGLLRSLVKKRSDHLTFLSLYDAYRSEENKEAFCQKYWIRKKSMEDVKRLAGKYYGRLQKFFRTQSGGEGVGDKKKIIDALIKSHQHLTAKNLSPVFSLEKIKGKIGKDSYVTLGKSHFLYDSLLNIGKKWEFRVITLI